MQNRISSFLRENSICVLATCADNRPHCSLMAYVADSRNQIFMATLRATRKYRNILQNPLVSLLVDNRHHAAVPQQQALTISGRCLLAENDAEKAEILIRIAEKHPHLQRLVELPDVAVLAVRPDAFLFMDGVLKSHYFTMEGGVARPADI